MAAGGNKGLKAGKSDPNGGCSFTLIVCTYIQYSFNTEFYTGSLMMDDK